MVKILSALVVLVLTSGIAGDVPARVANEWTLPVDAYAASLMLARAAALGTRAERAA